MPNLEMAKNSRPRIESVYVTRKSIRKSFILTRSIRLTYGKLALFYLWGIRHTRA